MIKSQKGQVTVETAVLFGVVVAGLVAMATYLQRGVQGGMRSNADSFGTQFDSSVGWESHARSASQETAEQIRSAQTSEACQGVGGDTRPDCDVADNAFPELPQF